jgi:hypothetical protein
MTGFVSTSVLDSGLSYATTNGTRVDITSTEATTYAQATTTYTLGNKTSATTGSPATRSPSGRKVTVASITGGTVTADGTAAYWALTDGATLLVATGGLSAGQAVTSGNTFSLAAFDIGIPAVGGS